MIELSCDVCGAPIKPQAFRATMWICGEEIHACFGCNAGGALEIFVQNVYDALEKQDSTAADAEMAANDAKILMAIAQENP